MNILTAQQLTFFVEEPLANPSASLVLERDWIQQMVTSHLNFADFLLRNGPAGSYGKTYQAFLVLSRMRRKVKRGGGIWQSADFATLLQAFRECGYSCAWRVLDGQHFGVPQRRRRVFVVGYLGTDWRPPAAVLFECESMRRDFTPRRKKGQSVAGTIDASAARSRGAGINPGSVIAVRAANTSSNGIRVNEDGTAYTLDSTGPCHVMATLDANYGRLQGASGQDLNHGHSHLIAFGGNNTSGSIDVATAVRTKANRQDFESETYLVQPAAFMPGQGAKAGGVGYGENTSPTLKSSASGTNLAPAVLYSIMAQNSARDYKAREVNVTQPLMAGGPVSGNQGGDYIHQGAAIRRLTPLECERLQGFPDHYTNIPGASDSARYSALGNSWAVPVARWIGERIQMVDSIIKE